MIKFIDFKSTGDHFSVYIRLDSIVAIKKAYSKGVEITTTGDTFFVCGTVKGAMDKIQKFAHDENFINKFKELINE